MKKSELEKKLCKLDNTFYKETAHLSIKEDKKSYPSYRNILKLGEEIIPILLKDLNKKKDIDKAFYCWDVVLCDLVKEPPKIPQKYAGNMQKILEYWVKWGKDNRYIK